MAHAHSDPADQAALPHQGEQAPTSPSHEGSVVPDIGAGTGALIIHACAEQDGMQIHVSPVDRPSCRLHAAVRPRILPAGAAHAAVITPLPRGLYTVWHDGTAHGIVAVMDGHVSEYRLTASRE